MRRNKYIIFTTEGTCQDPHGDDIANCQLLGRAKGIDEADAIHNLIQNNQWIKYCGYDPDDFIVVRLHDSKSV